jgi:hypothetical protein
MNGSFNCFDKGIRTYQEIFPDEANDETRGTRADHRRANEMTIDEAPAAAVYGGFATALVQ